MNQPSCMTEEELIPIVVGEEVAAGVREHLESCAEFRARLDRLRSEVSNLRATYGNLTATVRSQPASAATGRLPPVAPAPSVPGNIGRYRVIGELDSGGQARVYRVAHPNLPLELVVKLAHRPTTPEGPDRDRLVEEGKILAQLDHPNLARVVDLDFFEDRPFLVMEYVRGRNLRQRVEEQPPGSRQAAVLLAKVARAMASAHARGVLHLDLKPGNVVIDASGEPRIIDFGVGQIRDAWAHDAAEPDTIAGTPRYMAPEQARGEPADARSDVFALGALLYHLLTGQAPFAADSARESLALAARGEFDAHALRAAAAPAGLERICRRAMQADPADRYASAAELADDLEAFVRRPKRLAITAAAAGCIFLAALAVWLFRSPEGPPVPPPPPFDVELEVSVWRRGGEGVLEKADLPDALPLRPGDGLEIRGHVPPGTNASLFLFDSEGQLHDLPLVRDTAPDAEWAYFPAQGKAAPLTGPPGTVLLLLCARRSEPIELDEIRAFFQPGQPWPKLRQKLAHSLLILNRRQVHIPIRGLGPATDTPEADLLNRAETLRTGLADAVDDFAGRAFTLQEN